MCFGGLVDPGRVGGGEDLGVRIGAEAFRVPGAGCGQGRGPLGGFAGREAVVHVSGRVQPDAGVRVGVVVTPTKVVMNRRAPPRLLKRSGNTGANFNVLNHASE